MGEERRPNSLGPICHQSIDGARETNDFNRLTYSPLVVVCIGYYQIILSPIYCPLRLNM